MGKFLFWLWFAVLLCSTLGNFWFAYLSPENWFNLVIAILSAVCIVIHLRTR